MIERRFAVVDADGNGIWQRADCHVLIRRLCETFGHSAGSAAGRAVAAAQRGLFDTMLAQMDANLDGMISREEFVAGLGPDIADRAGFDAAVRSLLQVADADGNGVLDTGEYTRLAAVYGTGADEAGRAFARLDQDRNGVLTPPNSRRRSAGSSPAGTPVPTATLPSGTCSFTILSSSGRILEVCVWCCCWRPRAWR